MEGRLDSSVAQLPSIPFSPNLLTPRPSARLAPPFPLPSAHLVSSCLSSALCVGDGREAAGDAAAAGHDLLQAALPQGQPPQAAVPHLRGQTIIIRNGYPC